MCKEEYLNVMDLMECVAERQDQDQETSFATIRDTECLLVDNANRHPCDRDRTLQPELGHGRLDCPTCSAARIVGRHF